MTSAKDLGQAFAILGEYAELIDPPFRAMFTCTRLQWEMSLWPKRIMTCSELHEHALRWIATVFGLAEELSGQSLSVTSLSLPFAHTESQEADRLAWRWIRCNEEQLCFRGERASVDVAVETYDPLSVSTCLAECARILRIRHRTMTLAQRITETLLGTSGPLPTLEEVGKKLGMSRRTFQRRLAAEGWSFGELLTQFRQRYAAVLFEEGLLSAKEIAHRTGFRDVGSVYRLRREALAANR